MLSKFENITNETLKIKINVRYYYFKKTKVIALFKYDNKSEQYFIDCETYLEIPAKSTKLAITVYNFKEQSQSYGILGSGSIEIDRTNPYSSWFSEYSDQIPYEYKNAQDILINQLKANGKLDNKQNWGNAIADYCAECEVDILKSKGPTWQRDFWNNYKEQNGIIALKNSMSYEFKKFIKDDKIYYRTIGSLVYLKDDKLFDDFNKLLLFVEQDCRNNNCK